MTTSFKSSVIRETIKKYRIGITCASVDATSSGKHIHVQIGRKDIDVDIIRLKFKGDHKWVELDVAELLRRGVINKK